MARSHSAVTAVTVATVLLLVLLLAGASAAEGGRGATTASSCPPGRTVPSDASVQECYVGCAAQGKDCVAGCIDSVKPPAETSGCSSDCAGASKACQKACFPAPPAKA